MCVYIYIYIYIYTVYNIFPLPLQSTVCTVINATELRCITPPTLVSQMQLNYTIRVDNAPGPNPLANASLQIRVLPNPGNFRLVDTEYNTGSNTVIRIMVR